MSAHWAKVGAKVVCVDAAQHAGPAILKENTVYVVAEAYQRKFRSFRHGYGLHSMVRLTGLVNPYCPCGGWDVRRFRPLVTKTIEEDMELFAPLLKVELVGAPV